MPTSRGYVGWEPGVGDPEPMAERNCGSDLGVDEWTVCAVRKSYDGFGRPVRTEYADGSENVVVYRGALVTEDWDAEDLNQGGAHHGTPVVEMRDGHGRVVRREEDLGGGEVVAWEYGYNALGKVVERVEDAGSGPQKLDQGLRWVMERGGEKKGV